MLPQPSVHLSWAELACHDGTPYPVEWEDRAELLGAVFEDFRIAMGNHPIVIGSAYRTSRWNRRCGGAKGSQHLQGRALDCYPPAVMFLSDFQDQVKAFAQLDSRIGGVGTYAWGVHWDIRPRLHGRLITWNQIPAGTRLHDTRRA